MYTVHIIPQFATSLELCSWDDTNLGKYSGPSLGGHSQQRPPSLIRPQIFAAATINVFTSPSHQRPPL